MPPANFDGRLYEQYRTARGLSNATPSGAGAFEIYDKRYSRFLPTNREAEVLELGCGDGAFLAFLETKGFRNCAGVDSSPEQVRAAQAAGRTKVSGGDNIERLGQCVGSLDFVVAIDVIEHYNKPGLMALLDAIHTALKPDGAFLLQTPNADGPFGTRHRYADFTHELSFTPTSLAQALRTAGFRDIEFAPVEPIVHGVPSLIRWTLWKVIRLFLALYLAIETGVLRGHILTQNMIARARK